MHRWTFMTALLLAPVASAKVCVRIDAERDSLSDEDRRAAKITLEHALKKQGETVVQENCPATWTVYHVKLGRTVNVYLSGPKGEIDARAADEPGKSVIELAPPRAGGCEREREEHDEAGEQARTVHPDQATPPPAEGQSRGGGRRFVRPPIHRGSRVQ